MARRKYSAKKRMNKIEPSVMTLTFATASQSAGSTLTNYIDLSQVASLLNRRFYRQGINWAVAGFKFSSLKAGVINIKKLPNTWVMSNAWEKGFRAWQKMNQQALEETPSVRPRFLDFKVYADHTHAVNGKAANLLPLSAAGVAATPGEWEMSEVYTPNGPNFPGNTTNFEILATGANFQGAGFSGLDSVSLIEGYAASRGLPNVVDPNAPDDALDADGSTPENWLAAMFNEGTDQDSEVLEDMITKNNLAPYPFENDGVNLDTMYPGGANQLSGLQWHDICQLYSASGVPGTGIGTVRGKGGNFPCGLIKLEWTPDSEAGNLVMQIDLVPGSHRGYMCESMTEM